MKKARNIKVDAKVVKLTVICEAMSQYQRLFICQCECSQIVKVSAEELKTRKACLRCEAKKELQKFKPGDIVIYQNAIGEIAYGEQAIVNRLLSNSVEIEYRGKRYDCNPNELKKLGIKFMERILPKVRLMYINEQYVVAPKTMPIEKVKQIYGFDEFSSAKDFRILSFTDKSELNPKRTWAQEIERRQFSLGELPTEL